MDAAGGEEVIKRQLFFCVVVPVMLALLAVGVPTLIAQATTPTVEVNKPYTIGWDWAGDQADLTGFKVELGGSQVGGDIAPTLRQAVIPAPTTCGTSAIRVGAFNTGGTTWSSPLQVKVIGCPPPAPTGLRIVGGSL
jgi:hypothetical protein